ncbi:hypothetical protein [Parvularcula sp. IMCC14364]|uniref:hypothetical protein n=1 Tax=Parvularcula sp. IMCC14364 TaxID=3067902 RepID=UPI002740963B|nr:hypothetical protein [Parvularcula sp. IMCC14364]
MIRFATIFFCLLLAAAAAGRYQAEAGVRAQKAEIQSVEQRIAEEEAAISQLDLQVEVLESAERLARLSAQRLVLAPVHSDQLHTAEEFASLLRLDLPDAGTLAPARKNDFIVDAIAMADFQKLR